MGDPDRLAYLVFTSGTSGTPRAVAHAHRAIWARRMMVDGWYGLSPAPTGCCMPAPSTGPSRWAPGCWTRGPMGATALIPAPGDPARGPAAPAAPP
jgi:acyl-coenzyme A synthetase/AMP-(fatty) acid ligase